MSWAEEKTLEKFITKETNERVKGNLINQENSSKTEIKQSIETVKNEILTSLPTKVKESVFGSMSTVDNLTIPGYTGSILRGIVGPNQSVSYTGRGFLYSGFMIAGNTAYSNLNYFSIDGIGPTGYFFNYPIAMYYPLPFTKSIYIDVGANTRVTYTILFL